MGIIKNHLINFYHLFDVSADERKAIALKITVVVLAVLLLYGASVSLGTVVAAMAAKKLVVAWQFGLLNGAILGLKASATAIVAIAHKCGMCRCSHDNGGDIRKFLKYGAIAICALTTAGLAIGSAIPAFTCKVMGYNSLLVKSGVVLEREGLYQTVTVIASRDYLLLGNIPADGVFSDQSLIMPYVNRMLLTPENVVYIA